MKPISLLLVPMVALAVSGCTDAASQRRAADAPVVVVHVAPVTIERSTPPVMATGTLGSKEEVTLSFKVDGVIARILVNEGDKVIGGQLLASLELGEIDPVVARARAAVEKAERDHARAERLYADSVATLEQLQDAGTMRDAARAEYEAASFNRRHATIVAPAAGVILRRTAEPGEVVSAGVPILALGNRASGQVLRMGVSDRDVLRLRGGDHARVRFEAIPDRTFEGRVTEIGAAADPATGTYRVEVSLSAAGGLASGLVGTAEIRPTAAESLAMVPVESLLEADGGMATVYVLAADGAHAERRTVQLAFLDGERVAVRSGLEGVAIVVTDGANRLVSGARVEVAR